MGFRETKYTEEQYRERASEEYSHRCKKEEQNNKKELNWYFSKHMNSIYISYINLKNHFHFYDHNKKQWRMKLHILKQKSYNGKWKNACTCITNYEFVRVNSLNFLGTGNFFSLKWILHLKTDMEQNPIISVISSQLWVRLPSSKFQVNISQKSLFSSVFSII